MLKCTNYGRMTLDSKLFMVKIITQTNIPKIYSSESATENAPNTKQFFLPTNQTMPLSTVVTLPTAEILSGKNTRAWVSMVLYLKKKNIKILKQKKNPGSRLEVAC